MAAEQASLRVTERLQWKDAAALLSGAVLLHLALILPNHPAALTPGALRLVPLELPAVLLGLLALRGRAARAAAATLAVLLTVATALKLADIAAHAALSRPFDPVVDWTLMRPSVELLTGALGRPGAWAAVAAAGGLLMLAGLAFAWATGRWERLDPPARLRAPALAVAAAFAAVCIAETGHNMGAWRLPANPPGSAFATRLAAEEVRDGMASHAALRDFQRAAAADPLSGLGSGTGGAFAGLGARDLVVVFVESYGRASLDNPSYAPAHRALLSRHDAMLSEAGLSSRSAWLRSPIRGGQSWLAHATLASGLRIGDQARYRALLASPRRTLWHLASASGRSAVAVMPAITRAWPEADALGFDLAVDGAAMGYDGPAFNWVTMPDQFTLARLPALLDAVPGPRAVQVALISSHAPWTPVLPMLPWEEAETGATFEAYRGTGVAPAVLWQDEDAVRAAYRDSVAYALDAAFGYAARTAGTDPERAPLLLILGDHPAAPFVSQIGGAGAYDVPAHLVGPPSVLARFEGWGWSRGLVPGAEAPVWPMEAVRDRLVGALSEGGGGS